ncbi:MAG: plasmid mobilization relaxosome protein MobC [Oscillospiraceae bacterium]|nr:plasmid mobilization relaxosome protein MobC [Oscillospiraceae bacterium]
MPTRERPNVVKFYVSDEEKEFIKNKMAVAKTKNFSAYLRKMAMDGFILNVDYSMFRELNSSLQRIGNNINQILKRLNSTGRIYEADVENIKEKQEEIWRLQRFILSKLP